MPAYDFRCQQCGSEFELFYKSYAAYDAATPTCPTCGSVQLDRVIRKVSVQQPERDFSRMNANEMLNVLESGNEKQVEKMFEQVAGGGTDPRRAADAHQAAQTSANSADSSG